MYMYEEPLEFAGPAHEEFYRETSMLVPEDDLNSLSLLYVLGLTWETRNYVSQIFDFDRCRICDPADVMEAAWQTTTTRFVTVLAFNLWNGYTDPARRVSLVPDMLFRSPLARYYAAAVRLRFPEYFSWPQLEY